MCICPLLSNDYCVGSGVVNVEGGGQDPRLLLAPWREFALQLKAGVEGGWVCVGDLYLPPENNNILNNEMFRFKLFE